MKKLFVSSLLLFFCSFSAFGITQGFRFSEDETACGGTQYWQTMTAEELSDNYQQLDALILLVLQQDEAFLLQWGIINYDEDTLCMIDVEEHPMMCFSKSRNKLFCFNKRNSILHQASRYANDPGVVEVLVNNGEDVNAVNDEGESVADYAGAGGNPEIYAALVDLGMTVETARKIHHNKRML